jgi:hypothetical protein
MVCRITVLLFLFISSTTWGFGKEIAIENFISIVQENHPYFNKESLNVDISERQSESFLGRKDWNLNITPSYSRLGEVSAAAYENADRIENVGSDFSLSRKF